MTDWVGSHTKSHEQTPERKRKEKSGFGWNGEGEREREKKETTRARYKNDITSVHNIFPIYDPIVLDRWMYV